jgi:hypothetical protein
MDAKIAATSLSDTDVLARVDALLTKMSLAEKVGQLTQVGAADFARGPSVCSVLPPRRPGS